jgi:hypothetical protein
LLFIKGSSQKLSVGGFGIFGVNAGHGDDIEKKGGRAQIVVLPESPLDFDNRAIRKRAS